MEEFLALPWRVDRTFCQPIAGAGLIENNDVLAHLGDAAFRLLVTSRLVNISRRQLSAGHMTTVQAMIENRQQQSKFAVRLGLDKYVLLSQLREQQGGRRSVEVLERCFEALVGGMWLTFGPSATEQWVHQLVMSDTELCALVKRMLQKQRQVSVRAALVPSQALSSPLVAVSVAAAPKAKKTKETITAPR